MCYAGSNTTYTSDTIDQQHKAQTKQLKASNAKNGSHEFPEFLLEKFRNFETWGKTEFPEIRKSEFPELQSLLSIGLYKKCLSVLSVRRDSYDNFRKP